MAAGVSKVYVEEGQAWLLVSPGHAVSEHWLRENAADLYAVWLAAENGSPRDRIALEIELRLEHLEPPRSGTNPATLVERRSTPSELAARVARYEADARRLGATGLTDPGRPGLHLLHQANGDDLRRELIACSEGRMRNALEQRLDAADLIADRPLIDAVAGMDAQVDRLVAAIAAEGDGQTTERRLDLNGGIHIYDELIDSAEPEVSDQLGLPLHGGDEGTAGHDVDLEVS